MGHLTMAPNIRLGCLLLVAVTICGALDPLGNKYDLAGSKPVVIQDDVSQLMTLEAEQVIFDLKKELGFKAITGTPVPLYRKDLDPDYVAYWQVEFDGSNVILASAGPQTGDRKFILQGRLPGPTAYLSNTARDNHADCFRFYMLSPMGEMMCEDEEGNVVATNLDLELLTNVTNINPYDTAVNQFIDQRLCDINAMWAKHSVEIQRSGHWQDEIVTTEDDLDEALANEDGYDLDSDVDPDALDEDAAAGEDEGMFEESAVVPGETISVALGSLAMLSKIQIRPMPNRDQDNTNGSTTELQGKLCSVIGVCDENRTDGLVAAEHISQDPDTGLAVLEFHVAESFKDVFTEGDLDFTIEIHRSNGQVVVRSYGVEHKPSRQRRFKEYRSWSGFSYVTIPHEGWFPDYRQHVIPGRRCHVGCGPVAWAMIMGYLDRRAHYLPHRYGGSRGIYRSGVDGTTGSDSERAPQLSDPRMDKYTEKINDVLGTWCIGSSGATLMRRMTRIENFYQARQATGSPRVIKDGTWLTWLGVYRDSIASWTRARLREGWPVIVGTKEGWFTGWHYPVATQYRSRSRQWRRCVRIFRKKICGGWKTEWDNDMFLHMGWGGYKNGWYAMKSFYSVAAVY